MPSDPFIKQRFRLLDFTRSETIQRQIEGVLPVSSVIVVARLCMLDCIRKSGSRLIHLLVDKMDQGSEI